jgi:hypothetical protein
MAWFPYIEKDLKAQFTEFMSMKRTLKNLGRLLVVLAPVVFLYLSFINSKDCSQLVIDTYEVHSHINIPAVDFVNCYYDDDLKLRISVYDLKADFDFTVMQPVSPSTAEQSLRGFALLNEVEQPSGKELYLATGERWGRPWTYLYDQDKERLYAELHYPE